MIAPACIEQEAALPPEIPQPLLPPPPKRTPEKPADWATFPGWSDTPSSQLQSVYVGMDRAFKDLENQHDALCAGDDKGRKRKLRSAVAGLAPLVRETWATVQKAPEFREAAFFDTAVPTQVSNSGMPTVTPPAALLWLASEGLASAFCSKDPSVSWLRRSVRPLAS